MSAILTGLAMAAPGVIKGVGQLMSKPPQQKVSSDTTAYLNKLRNISKTGMYGQDVQNEMSTEIAQKSSNTQNAIRSSAVKQGMENSGVVAQQLIKEGGQTTLTAARMAKKIAEMNERSKLEAADAASSLGQKIEDINYQNSLAKFENRQNAIGNFADAFGAGIGGYNQANQFNITKTQKNKELALMDYFAMTGNWPK